MTSYQYRKSHCGDKTILRPSYLHNGISYTGKMSSLYWIRALMQLILEIWRYVSWLVVTDTACHPGRCRHNDHSFVTMKYQIINSPLFCIVKHQSILHSVNRLQGKSILNRPHTFDVSTSWILFFFWARCLRMWTQLRVDILRIEAKNILSPLLMH